ncbi:hypothetical protein [Granulicella sp. dw_53]|uniref:ORC-CDC6 family AAA ATPase n=1 Tax=Granulicella sp. dw_53 TaxID=2719792 RepID=UPI001BD4663D|nr:hypothetical protein [Granulicella sp. dw_53]
MSVISDPVIQKAVANIKQRSEKQRDIQKSLESFVDLGVIPQIATENNQIVYGRRGTGKTHLFNYLGAELSKTPQAKVVYIDCRTLGSSSQFSDFTLPIEHRCLALFKDILAEVHDALLERIIETPTQHANEVLDLLSRLEAAVMQPIVDRRIGSLSSKVQSGSEDLISLGLTGKPVEVSVNLGFQTKKSSATEKVINESVVYSDKVIFPAINNLLRAICEKADLLLFILLDEWSSLPIDIQPYLAEFIKRGFLPVNTVTVKIASLEYRSNFSIKTPLAGLLGLEVGADIATGMDLDDHYVFDRNKDRVTKAFADILYNHVRSEVPEDYLQSKYGITDSDKFVTTFFTNSTTSFQELARAAEGVARDLINIFTHAFFTSQRKEHSKIEKRTITEAAQQWFEQDKARELAPELSQALRRIVEEVIGKKKARSFMVPKELEGNELLQRLFDSRVLHLVMRGYADKDNPGVRYNIYTLDYGTYVSLLGTSKSPEGFEDKSVVDADFVVPFDDRRSIRRIILTSEVLHPGEQLLFTVEASPERLEQSHQSPDES